MNTLHRLLIAFTTVLTACASPPPPYCEVYLDPIQVEIYEGGVWIEPVENYEALTEYIASIEQCIVFERIQRL